jgi:WD40 repeat protein
MPDTDRVLVVTYSGTEIRDIQSGQRLAAFRRVSGRGAMSPDGKLLATSDPRGVVRIWETGTEHRVTALRLHPEASSPPVMAFSPDGRTIATGAFENDRSVRIWDVATGFKAVRAISSVGAGVSAVAFSPDGKRLAAAIRHQMLLVIDASSGRVERTISLGSGAVETHATVFSPDGKLLATAGESGTVKLWDPESGDLRAALKGHTTSVFAIAFSPDGGTIASGGADQTVKLWDVATGQERVTLRRHRDRVSAVAFSPDGNSLLTLDRSGAGWILRKQPVVSNQ